MPLLDELTIAKMAAPNARRPETIEEAEKTVVVPKWMSDIETAKAAMESQGAKRQMSGAKWRVAFLADVGIGALSYADFQESDGAYVTWIQVDAGALATVDAVLDGNGNVMEIASKSGVAHSVRTRPRNKQTRLGYRSAVAGVLMCICHDYPDLYPNT